MSLTANLQIQPQVPSEFTPAVPMTSSDFVVSRRMREYVSDGQTTFSFDGNNIIKFTLNSADAFLDGRNSWLQFKLWAAVSSSNLADYLGVGGIADVNGEKLSRLLESGGAHSLFSRLRISLSNGTIISDYDYSQLYAMIRQHTMSIQHLQFQEGMSSYDGVASDIYDYNMLSNKAVWTNLDVTQANAQTITLSAANPSVQAGFDLTTSCRVGDELAFVVGPQAAANMPSVLYGKVVAQTATPNMSIQFAPTIATYTWGANAANIQAVYRLNRGDLSHRFRGANGTAAAPVLCKVKLFSDFFNNIKYLPLPFLRNLTIELTLNRSAHATIFSKTLVANDNPALAWIVKDPVIVANLVTPSESLMNAYVEQYNSEQGIMLHWIDYQSNKLTAANAATDSVRIPSNCHSALAVLVAQKLPEAQSANTDSWFQDTNGTNVKQTLTSYQFQVGSEYFPFARPVDCSGTTNGNAWNYVLAALDSHGAKYECSSIVPNEYYAVNSISRPQAVAGGGANITNESLRFVLAARLDRDGNYTGIDTSNNDIQLNIIRTGAPVTGLYYHAFIIHNRLMRISKSSSIVFS